MTDDQVARSELETRQTRSSAYRYSDPNETASIGKQTRDSRDLYAYVGK